MRRLAFAVFFAAVLGAVSILPVSSETISGDYGTIAVAVVPCAGDTTPPVVSAINRRMDDRASRPYPEVTPSGDGLIHVVAGDYMVRAFAGKNCYSNFPVAVLPGRARHLSLTLGTTVLIDDSLALAGTVDVPDASVKIVRSDGTGEAVMDGKTFYFDRMGAGQYELDVVEHDESTARFNIDMRDAHVGDLGTVSISANQVAAALNRRLPAKRANLIDLTSHESWYGEAPSGVVIGNTPADLHSYAPRGDRTTVVNRMDRNVAQPESGGRSSSITLIDDLRPELSSLDPSGRLLFFKRDSPAGGTLYRKDESGHVQAVANPSSLPITPNISIVEDTFSRIHFEEDTSGLFEYRPLQGTHGFGVVRDGAGGFWALDCVAKQLEHVRGSGARDTWSAPGSLCHFDGYGTTELAAGKDALWNHAPRALFISKFEAGKMTDFRLPSTTASVRTGSLRVAPDGTLWFVERSPQRAAYIRNDRVVELSPFDDGSLPVTFLR